MTRFALLTRSTSFTTKFLQKQRTGFGGYRNLQFRRYASTLTITNVRCQVIDGDLRETSFSLNVWGKGSRPIELVGDFTSSRHSESRNFELPINEQIEFESNSHLYFKSETFIQRPPVPYIDVQAPLHSIDETPKTDGQLRLETPFVNYTVSYTVSPLITIPTTPPPYPDPVTPTNALFKLKSIICVNAARDGINNYEHEVYLKFSDSAPHPNALDERLPNTGDDDKIEMSERQIANVNHYLPFFVNLNIKAFDYDPLNADDSLGSGSISAHRVYNGLMTLNMGASEYKLIYDVVPDRVQFTPLNPISKDFIPGGKQQIWVGALLKLEGGAIWRVIDMQNNVIAQQGKIMPNEWNDVRIAEAEFSYKEIEIDTNRLPSDSQYNVQVLYQQYKDVDWDGVPTRSNSSNLTDGRTSSTKSSTSGPPTGPGDTPSPNPPYDPNNFVSGIPLFKLPTEIPVGEGEAFTALLASCYGYEFDQGRVVGTFNQLFPHKPPHVKFFTGDQVYLDHPGDQYTLTRSEESKELAERFLQIYRAVWGELASVFRSGANYFVSDDHELYNGYPHRPSFMPLATRDFLDRWGNLACSFFTHIQSKSIVKKFNIGSDLSFCVADTRLDRQWNEENFMKETDFKEVKSWIENLSNPGVLVLSQPIFVNPKSYRNSSPPLREESNMAAYEQYDELVKTLAASKHDIVILSGDVHFSRFAKTRLAAHSKHLYEILASPMSLIEKTREPGDGSRFLFDNNLGRVPDTDDLIQYGAEPGSGWRTGTKTELTFRIDRLGPLEFPFPVFKRVPTRPNEFPPRHVITNHTRQPIDYPQISQRKKHPNGDPIKTRAEENMSTIRFFKSHRESDEIQMQVKNWKIREKDEDGKPELNWEDQVTLKK